MIDTKKKQFDKCQKNGWGRISFKLGHLVLHLEQGQVIHEKNWQSC
jgi:hypothetical protein